MLNSSRTFRRQAGATLIEIMIGLALSLIVVSSMVSLMGNSLGSASRIIQMTQLSDELRNVMSMATRDLRRANYNANAYQCYENASCGIDGLALQVGAITLEDTDGSGDPDCMIFNLDRDQTGLAASYRAGGFRLSADGGVGFIEMWVGDADATPACDDASPDPDGNWLALTDPSVVDITEFVLDDSESITAGLTQEGGATLNQTMREINLRVAGALLLDDTITRRMEDTIKVRNDYLWDPNA